MIFILLRFRDRNPSLRQLIPQNSSNCHDASDPCLDLNCDPDQRQNRTVCCWWHEENLSRTHAAGSWI